MKLLRRALLAAAAAMLLAPAAHAAEAKATVTGEIIDSACYIKMGARGESHRECAQKCADSGIPLALLEDGTGKVVWLFSVDDAKTPNGMLRPYAGRKATVSGTWVERGGARILLVESVNPAKS